MRALVLGISVAITAACSFLVRVHPLDTLLARAGPPPEIYTHLAYAELLAFSSPSSSQGGDGAVKARAEAFDIDGVVWARFVREAQEDQIISRAILFH
ncbi:hypothetical protein B0H11DRAFT_2266204 [Mycena galericulata]|nr:hypothetical protein B0H11DRAFT_2266204 [Mycena galericulata]